MRFDSQKFVVTALIFFVIFLLLWLGVGNDLSGRKANVLLIFFLIATFVGAILATTRNRDK